MIKNGQIITHSNCPDEAGEYKVKKCCQFSCVEKYSNCRSTIFKIVNKNKNFSIQTFCDPCLLFGKFNV